MDQYLPFVSAVIVAVITAYVNYRVGNSRNTIDAKALINGSNEALRDDLLNLVDKYEAREKALVEKSEKSAEQNEQLRATVYTLRLEINELRIENQSLKADIQKLREELQKFERKVYYTGGEKQHES